MQMSSGALCTLLAGLWHGHSAAPVAGILLVAASTAQVALFLVRAPKAATLPASTGVPDPVPQYGVPK
jgi:hypothetical protein